MSNNIQKNNTHTDVIVILDMSGSMETMKNEPIQSVNTLIAEQRSSSSNPKETFTLVAFNSSITELIPEQLLSDTNGVSYDVYKPSNMTALNDAICVTIDKKLASNKPNDVVLVIITDGEENASKTHTKSDVKARIINVEANHDWKVLFFGANIDSFAVGSDIGISSCSQFNQNIPNNLINLSRAASVGITDYKTCKSNGGVGILELSSAISAPPTLNREPSTDGMPFYDTLNSLSLRPSSPSLPPLRRS